ncbi:hypothetical protein [Photobacterium galatheae]|uniref:Uncharacterized protein n=1 Tax=Photobacterium galatheae TaxID=1654360 RepID=A0A066RVZ6_9GAMM|nr:hypothetical protein [Photobacterium galatheae]KDM91872.1 hypothetical protein EA58_09085 [Photobacterium galatheae]MCM0147715.1 hypothetical protein [Photobacterium galatheae]
MIHEYAIAPSVLASWANNTRDYREFLREYGLGSPRIISSFPKAKASKLRGYLLGFGPQDQESIQGKRYLEMVSFLVETLVERVAPENSSDSWEQMVTSEHENRPFNVIIADPKLELSECISPSGMYDQGSCWSHQRQASIQRQVTPAACLLKNFLRFSTKQIVFIDPYGWTSSACSTFSALLKEVAQDRVCSKVPQVTLYYKESNSSATPASVKQQILEGIDIEGLKLQVLELKETSDDDVFHNRCVLTEHGGAFSGHGFGLSGEPTHTDDWFLLGREIYEKKWEQFVDDCRFEIGTQS